MELPVQDVVDEALSLMAAAESKARALGDPQGRCAACRCSRLLVLGAYTRPMLDFPVAFAPVKV